MIILFIPNYYCVLCVTVLLFHWCYYGFLWSSSYECISVYLHTVRCGLCGTFSSQRRHCDVLSTSQVMTKRRKQISKTIERSRYISTELGIRERLVSAIITNEDTVHSMAVSVNKTLSHHLQKLLFFFGTQEKGLHEAVQNFWSSFDVWPIPWITQIRIIRSRELLSQSEWILLSILKLKKSKFYINRYIISINTIKLSVQNQNVTAAMRQIYVNNICRDMSPNKINTYK